MRILLTGGAGFIGSHTVEHILATTDHEIVVLDSLSYAGDMSRFTDMKGFDPARVRFFYHDLRAPVQEHLIERIVRAGEVDTVINMASESHVDNSIVDPAPFIDNNVRLTVNMLELAREIKPRVFIQVSTDEVYGAAPEGYSHKEWDVILPSNPYAASKAAQEAIAVAYWRTYNVPLVITNTMNNFGERQHREKFLPIVVRNLLNETPIPLHGKHVERLVGDLHQGWVASSRVWLHARNHADALLWLANKGAVEYDGGDHSRPVRFNVAGDADLTGYDVVRLAANALQIKHPVDIQWIDYHSSRPGHDMRYSLDGTALREAGWNPPIGFSESFERTVRWMAAHPEWL